MTSLEEFEFDILDAGIYFDAETDRCGHDNIKLTSISGEVLNLLREKETALRRHYGYKKYVKSTMIEKDQYKIMLECRLDKAYLIMNKEGNYLPFSNVEGGMQCDVRIKAKKWQFFGKVGYTLYIYEMVVYEKTRCKKTKHRRRRKRTKTDINPTNSAASQQSSSTT